jgi:hypothetical protein
MTPRRVVLLSPGGKFADALLGVLGQRGIEVDALLLYLPGAAGEWRKAPTAVGRMRSFLRAPLRWARRRWKQHGEARALGRLGRVVSTGTLNGVRMMRHLRRLRPDVLVLAHCGIVQPHVLRIPGDGVLNVHPGLLPWIRGNSPIGHSLQRGVPLGATAFRVDPGIDTGAILTRRLVPIRGGETVEELREALFRLWVEMTADVVAQASAGRVPPGLAQPGRFPLCRTLPVPEQRAILDDAVLRDEPKALFDRWAAACDPVEFALPPDAEVTPMPRLSQ